MTRRNATTSACTNGDVLTYDPENRLTSITVGGTTTTFVYNGDSNRVKKVAGGVTTFYVGNYFEVTNGVATKYYYFGKQRVAMRVGTNPVTYLHGDHLGSTSATSGASVSAQTYYAFGNIRSTTGTVPTDFGFTGHRRDASAGLMYFGARYYDTTLGRFLGPDTQLPAPLTPQSLNRYSYVGNNPLRYTDPNGHCWPVCTVIAGAAIGAIIGGASVALPQMIENVQRGEPLTANIDPGEVAKAAAVGAVAGAVGGATFGVGLAAGGAIAGAVGITSAGGAVASAYGVATVAVSGALAGQTSRAATNLMTGQSMEAGLLQSEDMVTDAALSVVGFKVFGGNFRAVPPAELTAPGPFAKGSVTATGPKATISQRGDIQELGDKFGCHHCGTGRPGGYWNKWIADHIPPTARAGGAAQALYPQCDACRAAQAQAVQGYRSSLLYPNGSTWGLANAWGAWWMLYDQDVYTSNRY